jgi:uncharacterized membrane protein YgdD (TMEM256/DUF423 family)
MSVVVRVLIVIAGLMGAAGVALAALGAHGTNFPHLASASSMLLFHAPATLAAVLLINRHLVRGGLAIAAAFGLASGAALFATDLAMRDLAGHSLFSMAAPTGGTLLIASWVALAASGLFASHKT